MWTVSPLSGVVQTLLTRTANTLAHDTGCVPRASKLTGAHFAHALRFGWLNTPQATLQHLAQMAGRVGVAISPQGREPRFTEAAALFLQRLLEVAVTHMGPADPVAIPLGQRFAGVSLRDALDQRLAR